VNNEIESQIRSLSDTKLLNGLANSGDYLPETFEIVKGEVQARGGQIDLELRVRLGSEIEQEEIAAETKKSAGWANAALLCALAGGFLPYGFAVLIIGFALGIEARRRIKADPSFYRGDDRAKAAMVLCALELVLLLVLVFLEAKGAE